MSGEQIVGHVSWSPDFESSPDNEIQKLLDEGRLKMAPRFEDDKLLSVDLVRGEEPFPGSDTLDEKLREVLRPHQNEPAHFALIPAPIGIEMHFTYTNWKGKTGQRRAIFSALWFGTTEYHPEAQLLLHGYDLDKQAPRTYAVKDIVDLKPL